MHYFIKSPDLVHGIIDPNPPEYYFSLFPRHFVCTTVHDLTILVHKFANATKKAEPVLCLSKKLY